jgi:hypothetical protein
METNKKCRIRGSNFSELEKQILADILNEEEFHRVLENKKQNGSSNREKEIMWLKVVKIFNSNQNVNIRTAAQLKQCYINLKRQVKGAIANDRLEKFKTGSGPFKPPMINETGLKVYEAIRDQVHSLKNKFDTDAHFHGKCSMGIIYYFFYILF